MLLPTVTQVGLRFLPCLQQLLLQSLSKDVDIWVGTTRKGSVDPNDVASNDAQRNLVPVTRGFELEGIEVPPRMLCWQSKISSINRDLASLASITDMSVGPDDLQRAHGTGRPTKGFGEKRLMTIVDKYALESQTTDKLTT